MRCAAKKAVNKNNSTGHYEYEPIIVKILNCDGQDQQGGKKGLCPATAKKGNCSRMQNSSRRGRVSTPQLCCLRPIPECQVLCSHLEARHFIPLGLLFLQYLFASLTYGKAL